MTALLMPFFDSFLTEILKVINNELKCISYYRNLLELLKLYNNIYIRTLSLLRYCSPSCHEKNADLSFVCTCRLLRN